MVLPIVGYSVYGFGYGVGKADPWVTCGKPYLLPLHLSATGSCATQITSKVYIHFIP